MKLPIETLKKIIVGSGFVQEKDFDDAAKTAIELDKEITDVLIFRGLINEETIAKLTSEHFGVSYTDIARINIPQEILSLIPEKMARVYRIVPFEKDGGKLKLAMEDPENFEALEFAKRHTGLEVIPYYSDKESIIRALGQYKKGIKEDFQKIISENLKKATKEEDLAKAAEEVPIVRILDSILSYAISEKASDVHIETQEDEVIVRFRIDGILRDIVKLSRGVEAALVARIKILSNLKIDEHRVPQDGRHKFSMEDQIVSLRVTQIQVNPKTGVEFSAGLRALMRHDPDIIMVCEIRDQETAEIAIHSALTGHLVLTTLHTNTAA